MLLIAKILVGAHSVGIESFFVRMAITFTESAIVKHEDAYATTCHLLKPIASVSHVSGIAVHVQNDRAVFYGCAYVQTVQVCSVFAVKEYVFDSRAGRQVPIKKRPVSTRKLLRLENNVWLDQTAYQTCAEEGD